MWIAAPEAFGLRKTEFAKKRYSTLLGIFAAGDTMVQCCFDHLVHQPTSWIERGCGRLRDIGNTASTDRAQAFSVALQNVLTL